MSTGMQNAISRTSQSFAPYYDANVNGNVYTFGISNTALVAANAVATGLTATSKPVVGLWNDVGTGKNLVVLNATVVATTLADSAVAPGGFVWYKGLTETSISTGSTPGASTAITQPQGMSEDRVDGSIIVPPGGVLSLMNQVATTTVSLGVSITWAEENITS